MYEPELGQMIFGQPYKEHKASNLMIAALRAIGDELGRVMWNIHQEIYASPFDNTGNAFKEIQTFQVEAYSWNEEYEQPWNFKWKDIEVSWYKYYGRGTSVNREVSPLEIAQMLDACLSVLLEYDEWR
ncbi:hypothetical protein LCGC14_2981660, partial [marine sediment metagenome]